MFAPMKYQSVHSCLYQSLNFVQAMFTIWLNTVLHSCKHTKNIYMLYIQEDCLVLHIYLNSEKNLGLKTRKHYKNTMAFELTTAKFKPQPL